MLCPLPELENTMGAADGSPRAKGLDLIVPGELLMDPLWVCWDGSGCRSLFPIFLLLALLQLRESPQPAQAQGLMGLEVVSGVPGLFRAQS